MANIDIANKLEIAYGLPIGILTLAYSKGQYYAYLDDEYLEIGTKIIIIVNFYIFLFILYIYIYFKFIKKLFYQM